jgi:hypothetical protein
MDPREILFEFTAIGTAMRVTAIDAATGAEAVIQGHAGTGRAELQRVAMRKLAYVMKKREKEGRS